MRRGVVMALAIATLVAGTAPGLGASLTVSSRSLLSTLAPITTCDRDGITVTYNSHLVLLTVGSVNISAVADGSATPGLGACDGRTFSVQLLDGAGRAIAGATGARLHLGDTNVANDVVVVTISTPPLTLLVSDARVVIS